MMKKNRFWLLPVLAAILILCLACGGSKDDKKTGNDSRTGEQTEAGETPVPAETAAPTDVQVVEPTAVPTEVPTPEAEVISIVTPEPDLHREELDAILRRTTMLEGVTVNGVAVGGMTKEEAKAAVLASLDAKKGDMRITVTLGDVSESFSAETIAVDDDLNAVIDEAFAIVREDNGWDAVSEEVESIRTNGRDFPVTMTFNEDALRSAVDAFAGAHETAPVNASVAYNEAENRIDFKADVPGRSVDREALLSALRSARFGETISAPAAETSAEITLADVQSKYVLRSSFTTKYSKSIDNRKYNIFKGAGMITGTILHPGDTFSANGTLGVRNKSNGWKVATAYVQGKHEKQYGGGVCQLSSTLYNAAVLADMKIIDRKNHSMPVDYVEKGRDATINSTGNLIDFKFQNSSKSDIIIIAYVDNTDYKKAGKLTMEIWGVPIIEDSNGEYDEIRIPTPKKTKTLKPSKEVEYQVDVTKPVGYKEQIVKNQNGSVYESEKEYYLNGNLVKSESLATSTYKAYAAVYIVGPDPTPAPDTPKPTETPVNTQKPTEPPADTPKPTEPPADTPKPTEPPADTPKPTEPPADTPKPTEPPADTPKPTEPPADTPKPTEPPADTPKPTEPPADTPKPTEPPADTPKPTEPPADTPKPTEPPADEPGNGDEG